MKNKNRKYNIFNLKATIATVAFVASASLSGMAMAQDGIPQGWFKTCAENAGTEICTVQNIRRASTGQLVTGMALITVDGPEKRRIVQVSVPSGRFVTPGIQMRVDDGKPINMPYTICLPDRCVTEIEMTDSLITNLKKGNTLTLMSVNFRRQPNPVGLTLEGFTAAFDGPALDQRDLIENQKKLQEELAAKAEEERKRLEEAQKDAKK